MASLFGVSLSGLFLAQAQFQTTQHNISNANTPGYHRQRVNQSAVINWNVSGVDVLGNGVKLDNVERMYSEGMERQILNADTNVNYYEKYSEYAKTIDDLFSTTDSSVSPVIDDFFKTLHANASNPNSMPSRQALLTSAETVVQRLKLLDDRLEEMYSNINTDLKNYVDEINNLSQQIATINKQIYLASGQLPEIQQPNDLLDKRDYLVTQLNQLVKTTILDQKDGNYNVFFGSGQLLTSNDDPSRLELTGSVEAPQRLGLTFSSAYNNRTILPESLLEGGKLTAAMNFRSEVLDPAKARLGQIAAGLAVAFNDQHRRGLNLDNKTGVDFFTLPVPRDPVADTSNKGTAVFTSSFLPGHASDITASRYKFKSIQGDNFEVTRLSDNVSLGTFNFSASITSDTIDASGNLVPGNPYRFADIDGVRYTLKDGLAASGDTFYFYPTEYAAKYLEVGLSDAASVALASPIRSMATLATGSKAAVASLTVNPSVYNGSIQPATYDPPPELVNSVEISFSSATNYTLKAYPGVGKTGTAVTSSGVLGSDKTISFNGWTLALSGDIQNTDTFTVEKNTNGFQDGNNGLRLADLQTAKLLRTYPGNGNVLDSFQGIYNFNVTAIGQKTNEVNVLHSSNASQLQDLTQQRNSLSGVNMDEEGANLMKFQQAYIASSKAIKIADELLSVILNLRA